jgi:hypothetical protein
MTLAGDLITMADQDVNFLNNTITEECHFLGVALCGVIINRCFRGTCHLTLFLARDISSTLKMEATHFSETSVYNKPARRHIP